MYEPEDGDLLHIGASGSNKSAELALDVNGPGRD